MHALLLVDMQNDFFPDGALGVKRADEILPVINKLLEEGWDLVVASLDWHPENHGSFAPMYGKEVGEVIDLEGIPQILWPVHCVQNTKGSEFVPGLPKEKIDEIVYKGTDPKIDSYSAFFDNGRRKGTGLLELLKGKGITEITIAGLTTDYCVKDSVMDALDLGFKVHIVPEGCRPVDVVPGDGEKALKEMVQAGAHLHFLQESPAKSE